MAASVPNRIDLIHKVPSRVKSSLSCVTTCRHGRLTGNYFCTLVDAVSHCQQQGLSSLLHYIKCASVYIMRG